MINIFLFVILNSQKETMPLQVLDTPSYVKRTKVFVSFTEKKQADPNDFEMKNKFELPVAIQNVIGIELVNHTFSRNIFPSFVGRYKTTNPSQFYDSSGLLIDGVRNSVNGSNTVDVEFSNAAGVDTIVVSFDFEFVFLIFIYMSFCNSRMVDSATYLYYFAIVFGLSLYPSLPVVGSFDPNDYNLSIYANGESRIEMYLRRKVAPFDYGRVRLLFATGPTSKDSAHKQMGFDKIDTIPDPINNGVVGQYLPNPIPFRYTDLNIRQFNEFKPLARLLAASDDMGPVLIAPESEVKEGSGIK